MPSRKKIQGFTLLEILLVVVIIGILTSIVGYAVSGNSQRLLEREVNRLQQVLTMVADEALLSGMDYGFVMEADRYRIVRFNTENTYWEPAENDAFSSHQLPEGMGMSITLEGEKLNLIKQENNEAGKPALNPGVLLLSSGEMTDFSIHINSMHSSARFTVFSDQYGDIKISRDAGT